MLSSAKPQRRRRVKEVSPARQGWEKVSETKPERRRRESSRRTQPKHAWKLKQGISTLVFECLKRRVTQPSNGTRIPQPLRAGLTSDCSFGAGLWQCTPSSHLNVMKLPRSQRRTRIRAAGARQHSHNHEWESTDHNRCFHRQNRSAGGALRS